MKKRILIAVAAITLMSIQMLAGGVKVKVSPTVGVDSLTMQGYLFTDMLKATKNNPPKMELQNVPVKEGVALFELPVAGFGQYMLMLSPDSRIEIYANPEDNLEINLANLNDYEVKGSPLMEDIETLRKQFAPIEAEYDALMKGGNPTKEGVMALAAKFENAAKDFVNTHPESPVAAYAMLEIEGEDFLNLFPTMTDAARQSPFYPVVEQKYAQVQQQVAREKKRAALSSGTVDAPAFTLDNLEGTPVSLSDFKGKWVVLDFWGSWCKWCIKGFPDLKEAYKKYNGKLEIIGIDNRDSKEDWKAAVERFKLPWVHVYNPKETGQALLDEYCVEGFPTKAIISPEGKVMDITVGEDPSFFDRLAKFVGE